MDSNQYQTVAHHLRTLQRAIDVHEDEVRHWEGRLAAAIAAADAGLSPPNHGEIIKSRPVLDAEHELRLARESLECARGCEEVLRTQDDLHLMGQWQIEYWRGAAQRWLGQYREYWRQITRGLRDRNPAYQDMVSYLKDLALAGYESAFICLFDAQSDAEHIYY